MKLVREHINEKFVADSDPIKDMGIGRMHLIEEWIKKTREENKGVGGRNDPFPEGQYFISNDYKINVNTHSYISDDCGNLPEYIQFGTIKGHFSASSSNLTSLRGVPIYVEGSFFCNNNKLTSLEFAPKRANYFDCRGNSKIFTKKEVRAVCKVKLENISVDGSELF